MPQKKLKPTLNQMQQGSCRAYFPIEGVRAIDEEKRTVEVAFSSDREIEQWWHTILILEHTKDACDLRRLNNGGPVLFNHDRSAHIGVVETARIDADGKGRAVIRFSRSALGEEKFRDVVDGILLHASVGFETPQVKLVESRDGDIDVYRATLWVPFEISLVPIPADDSVGVGRSFEEDASAKPKQSEKRSMPMPKEDGAASAPRVDLQGEREAAVKTERARMNDLLQIGREYGASDEAERYVREGKSVDSFRQFLLEKMGSRRDKPTPDEMNDPLGLSEKEVKRYSFVKVLRALDPANRLAQEEAAFELEVSAAAAKKMNRTSRGIVVPTEVLFEPVSRTYSTDPASGKALVGTDLLADSFIEMLRKRCLLMQLGTKLTGLVGNVDIPKQLAGATGYVVGEDQEVQDSSGRFGNLSLSPTTVGGLSEISRRLIMQDSLDVEALVRSDLAAAVGLKIDNLGLYGSGSDEPTGLKNVSGVNAVNFAAAGKPTLAELVQMESEISADDADVENMGYLFNARMRGHCKTTPCFPNGEITIWQDKQVNGYTAGITNQVANGDVFFGNWADLIIGMWGGLELMLDPYTHSSRGRLRIVAMQDVDTGVRHAESFCVGTHTAA